MMGFGLVGLLFLVLIGVGVAYALGWLPLDSLRAPGSQNKPPLDILKERYARGEISKAEYDEMRRSLTD